MELRKILVTGATGTVGRELCIQLIKSGFKLVVTGRAKEETFRRKFSLPCEYIHWPHPESSEPSLPKGVLWGAIHLMGESLAGDRWSAKRMRAFESSRIDSTRYLVQSLEMTNPGLQVLITASAIGFYGSREDENLSEASTPGNGFLSRLCEQWEAEARKSRFRNVQLRIGMVLASQGGALQVMEPIFNAGFGGPLGNGRQWMSWIHIEDLCRIIIWLLGKETIVGPINAVSPQPVTNNSFTNSLANALQVQAYIPAPAPALRIIKGKMASMILASQKVFPEILMENSFEFKHPELFQALTDLYSWKKTRKDRLFLGHQWVPEDRDRVFQFFTRHENFMAVSPPWLNTEMISFEDLFQMGSRFQFRFKTHKLSKTWTGEITEFRENHSFTDRQLQGPFRSWNHQHQFASLGGGTLIMDRIVYQLPRWMDFLPGMESLVLKDLNRMFEYRHHQTQDHFSSSTPQ